MASASTQVTLTYANDNSRENPHSHGRQTHHIPNIHIKQAPASPGTLLTMILFSTEISIVMTHYLL